MVYDSRHPQETDHHLIGCSLQSFIERTRRRWGARARPEPLRTKIDRSKTQAEACIENAHPLASMHPLHLCTPCIFACICYPSADLGFGCQNVAEGSFCALHRHVAEDHAGMHRHQASKGKTVDPAPWTHSSISWSCRLDTTRVPSHALCSCMSWKVNCATNGKTRCFIIQRALSV